MPLSNSVCSSASVAAVGETGTDGAMPAPEAVNPAGPGGLEVAFAANKTGPYNLFVRPLTGGAEVALDSSPWNQVPTSWSPDGRYLAFTEFNPATGADVWVLDRLTRAQAAAGPNAARRDRGSTFA